MILTNSQKSYYSHSPVLVKIKTSSILIIQNEFGAFLEREIVLVLSVGCRYIFHSPEKLVPQNHEPPVNPAISGALRDPGEITASLMFFSLHNATSCRSADFTQLVFGGISSSKKAVTE